MKNVITIFLIFITTQIFGYDLTTTKIVKISKDTMPRGSIVVYDNRDSIEEMTPEMATLFKFIDDEQMAIQQARAAIVVAEKAKATAKSDGDIATAESIIKKEKENILVAETFVRKLKEYETEKTINKRADYSTIWIEEDIERAEKIIAMCGYVANGINDEKGRISNIRVAIEAKEVGLEAIKKIRKEKAFVEEIEHIIRTSTKEELKKVLLKNTLLEEGQENLHPIIALTYAIGKVDDIKNRLYLAKVEQVVAEKDLVAALEPKTKKKAESDKAKAEANILAIQNDLQQAELDVEKAREVVEAWNLQREEKSMEKVMAIFDRCRPDFS